MRTTEQLLEQAQNFLPPSLTGPLEPVLGANCASLALAEQAVDGLHDLATLEGATGQWLDLHAQGQGLDRRDGEEDVGLRTRLRRPDEQVTPNAILTAVNILLAPYTSTQAIMREPWRDGPFWDQFFWDQEILSAGLLTFTVICPRVGTDPEDVGMYYDHSFYDRAFYSATADHPVYASIYQLLQRDVAAVFRAFLVIDDEGIFV